MMVKLDDIRHGEIFEYCGTYSVKVKPHGYLLTDDGNNKLTVVDIFTGELGFFVTSCTEVRKIDSTIVDQLKEILDASD